MNLDSNPLVSVVMPTFNHTEKQLTTAIYSILNQSFKNLEIIIIDGNPKNFNLKIISSIKDSRIKYFKTKGYVNCLNYGIKNAKGKYIARMDSDDIAHPDRIKEQLKFLEENPEISCCSCLVKFFGNTKDLRFSQHKNEVNLINLTKAQEFIHSAMMFRKTANIEFKDLKPVEDCLLFRDLLLDGQNLAIIDKVLLKNYISDKSIMAKYPDYVKVKLSEIDTYALSKYYNFNLSFFDKIFSKKYFSKKEILEFLSFIDFLESKKAENDLDRFKICFPYFSYMTPKFKSKIFLFKNILFYKTIVIPYLKVYLKKFLKFIFSITNSYYYSKKIKVICIFGLRTKIRVPNHNNRK